MKRLAATLEVVAQMPHTNAVNARLGPPLAEMRRGLAPGGRVALALFGGATLQELAAAWQAALPAGAGDAGPQFGVRAAPYLAESKTGCVGDQVPDRAMRATRRGALNPACAHESRRRRS